MDAPCGFSMSHNGSVDLTHPLKEASMANVITTIGLDLAKLVFQVHGADTAGKPLLKKRLRRGQVLKFFAGLPPCLIGMEACSSAHYWARELQSLGHEVRLIAPQFVKPFVKTNKNDAADAEAICEALLRPTMRFSPIKSVEQQSVLMLHRVRELLVRQRTQLFNALRGHCGEFGIVVAQGIAKVGELIRLIEDESDDRISDLARGALRFLVDQLKMVKVQITGLEKKLKEWHRSNEASRRLETIPGVGVITATALVATIGDARQFKSGRELAAWLGLVPKQSSSGNKQRLGRISKRGDGYLRRLLVHGARTVLRWSKAKQEKQSPWLNGMLARKPTNVVLVAMANKTARVVWALLNRGETFNSAATA
jgi:transposase